MEEEDVRSEERRRMGGVRRGGECPSSILPRDDKRRRGENRET